MNDLRFPLDEYAARLARVRQRTHAMTDVGVEMLAGAGDVDLLSV